MKKFLFIVCCELVAMSVMHAQESVTKKVATDLADYKAAAVNPDVEGWKHSGLAGISFGQTSLHNWVAGGDNTVSGNFMLNLTSNYFKNKWFWDNNLAMEYGLVRSSSVEYWQKASDRINLKSIAGRNISPKWSGSFLLNFNTQFAKGHKYPDTDHYISTFMAPAYADAALGFTYKPNDHYTMFISPIAERATFVLDDSLSTAGLFGVDAGQKVKWETGAYLTASTNQTLWTNTKLISTLDMFTPYNENFGNVNINWHLLIDVKLNKWLSLSLTTTLRYYDAEIRKIQFKEIFGLGLTYQFQADNRHETHLK